MQDFHFIDAGAVVFPGDWVYVATADPHLGQQGNPQTFVGTGLIAVTSGSKALYMPQVVHDGMVSVRTWSSDDDAACIVFRYQDDLHYYRACLTFRSVNPRGDLYLVRITGAQVITVGTYLFSTTTLHNSPGHVIGVEAVGQSIRAYLDGAQVIEHDDPGGYSFGRVGIEDLLLRDAHFDDFTVVAY